ncbi:MAG: CaiB/BaiF CoA-transferase family protein [Rubrivivax sp.]
MQGPLKGLKVIEMPAIGPVPFCGMLLADLGADVLRIDRTQDSGLGIPIETRFDLLGRGKRSLALDLKSPADRDTVLGLADKADVLLEGFRPGTMERLGLGPDAVQQRNPRLIYGRMTGWGQEGPMAQAAGHDINYIALAGALAAIGHEDARPVPPINLVGDFGGGTLYLAMGVLAALHERQSSGRGQVVDTAMVDGTASLMTVFHGLLAQGVWQDARGVNDLDSGAPWYDTYACKDGGYVAVGALEGKFFAELVGKLGLDSDLVARQHDRAGWPAMRKLLGETFLTRTRDEWCALLEGSDACFAPVLSLREAPAHPHMKARGTFGEHFGVLQPRAAPRFSRTPGAVQGPPPARGEGGDAALRDWGLG